MGADEEEPFLALLLAYLQEMDAFQATAGGLSTPEGARSYLRHLRSDPGRSVWWLLRHGERIGFAVFRLLLWTSEPTGMIDDLYVVPMLRRRGYGRRAVEAVLEHLRQAGATSVRLQALAANQAAVDFWGGLGFASRGLILGTAHLMERPLSTR